MAEIYNKISQTGSNLTDRLEDKLTGDFFGTIRYLPFEIGLKNVLSVAIFNKEQTNKDWQNLIDQQKGYETHIEFWHREAEGEIDILISRDNAMIGIEVKYLSGISSEDDEIVGVDYTDSLNQLSRYSRMLERISGNKSAYLLFLAPYKIMRTVRNNLINRNIITPSVEIGYICWQDILESLHNVNFHDLEVGQQLILSDLKALLIKKGFIRFHGFRNQILEQQVTTDVYYFKHNGSSNKEKLIWSNKTVERNDYYIYNN